MFVSTVQLQIISPLIMPRILVTGATGFIGGQLAQALAAAGDDVVCLARRSSCIERIRLRGVRIVEGDVTAPESIGSAVAGVDVVYHLAGLTKARSRTEFFDVNEAGVANVLDACRRRATPPVVVLVSSLAAAGPATGGRPRVEEDPPGPVSIYGRSKRAGELAAIARAGELPITIIRPPVVLGEGDAASLTIFRMVAKTGVHLVPGWRPPRLSVVYVADLVDAIIAAARKGTRLPAKCCADVNSNSDGPTPQIDARGFYFVAGDEQPTFADLGRLVGEAVGRQHIRVIRLPRPLVWPIVSCTELTAKLRGRAPLVSRDKAREALADDWTCSPAKAIAELGFSPRARLAEYLRQTAAWYRREGWL
jgi:nucleoside-diphosphate-sugar epimerase